MVNVNRLPEPTSLRVHSRSWTYELQQQIKTNGSFSKVSTSYKNRYKQADVQDVLEEMYGEKCCFCEGHIGVCSYEHIEHRKPKSKFPEYAFDWSNLHWCCQICNMSKKEKWDANFPILDPVVDSVEQHLDVDLDTCHLVPLTQRAATTIAHADLNRRKLVEARKRLKGQVLRLLLQAQVTDSSNDRAFYQQELARLTVNDPANGEIAVHSFFVKKLLADVIL